MAAKIGLVHNTSPRLHNTMVEYVNKREVTLQSKGLLWGWLEKKESSTFAFDFNTGTHRLP
jgi:hypothetical protein